MSFIAFILLLLAFAIAVLWELSEEEGGREKQQHKGKSLQR